MYQVLLFKSRRHLCKGSIVGMPSPGRLIIISMKVKNCTNIRAKVFVILYANFWVNCSHLPCGIFEKMTSFSPILNQNLEQGKLMVAVNSRK